MKTSLTIIRYRTIMIPFGFLSMAVFHLPLFLTRSIKFYKLMGCGKNGTFDKVPDLNQWAILTVHDDAFNTTSINSTIKNIYGKFISNWIDFFSKETITFFLEPIAGHGLWDKKKVFGNLDNKTVHTGKIATLTRATIRLSKLKFFWKNVAPVANKINTAKGFIFSAGIGEIPWIKQATFSVWESAEDMKAFAYSMKEHSDVIKMTRQQQWYSEDMFVRFRILSVSGSLNGINPLERKA